MARVKKPQPTLDLLLFQSPEQKVLRFLLTEPTTTFLLRVLASKLKGVRGLGGAEGMQKILLQFEEQGLVEFLDNRRSVRLVDEHPAILVLKVLSSHCDLEGLQQLLQPFCSKGILFGSRATGRARTDSDFDLFVVTEDAPQAKRVTEGYPLGRTIELVAWTAAEYEEIERRDPGLAQKLAKGSVLWGSTW
jgi:hypothetical protein